jgi:hypothetical protein
VIGQDELAPLPAGVTPKLPFATVFADFQKRYAVFLSDPARLTVLLGWYTYTWQQGQTHSGPAYVIRGGTAPCESSGGPAPGELSSSARIATPAIVDCAETLVVDADTGAEIVLQERALSA